MTAVSVARRSLGAALSAGVYLYRDSESVRVTAANLVRGLPGLPKRALRKPTVACVFAGRNDDYVPDNEARIRAVIEWNSRVLCDEIIFVEWNPLADRPLLGPALCRDYANVRTFVVPPEVHARVCGNPRIPVMEYFAKNVGIRRAHSDYICATNADILWDAGVARMRWLLSGELVFRTRRVELAWDGSPPTARYLRDPDHQIEYRFGWRQDIAYGSGDFTLASRALWHRARGYDEALNAPRISCDGRGLFQLLELGGRVAHLGRHYHMHHGSSSAAAGNVTHGEQFDYREGLPYENSANWGLGHCTERPLGDRVALLEWPVT